MAEQIVLIGNPIAGGGAAFRIKKAAGLLAKKGYTVRLMLTGQKGDAEAFAKGLAGQPVQLVIAAGGDGTYNEVANGLALSNVPMAILPLGTTSVLARELHIPRSMGRALDIALSGNIQTVHLGKITLDLDDTLSARSRTTRYFLLMAGIGFDAEAVLRANQKIKKFTGKGAYLWSGLKVLAGYNPAAITLSIRNEPGAAAPARSIRGYGAVIGKASCYGGRFKATPDARLSEPYFYVFVTHKNSKSALFHYVLGVITGKHIAFSDISYFRAAEIVVDGKAPVQLDGDYEGMTPAKVEIEKNALRLVTPTIFAYANDFMIAASSQELRAES